MDTFFRQDLMGRIGRLRYRQFGRKTDRREDFEQGDVPVLGEEAADGLRIRLIRLGGPHMEAPVVRERDMLIRSKLGCVD
jgi:hypothetical protein